jgi:hypothetical protein
MPTKFAIHPIVAQLVKEPASLPKLVVMNGYLGASDAGTLRIYASPTLDSYFELPEESVKHVVSGTAESDPQVIWVDAMALLTPGPEPTLTTTPFLAGDITARYWGAQAIHDIAPNTSPILCNPTPAHLCPPTPRGLCPPPPTQHGCPPPESHGCPPPPATPLRGCPPPVTQAPLHCPTSPFRCPQP